MRILFLILFSFLFSNSVLAASISKISGNKVLINLEGSTYDVDSEFYVVNSSGKRTGRLKITSIKGERAIGRILKGTAAPGSSLADISEAKKSKPKSKVSSESDTKEGQDEIIPLSSSKKKKYGVIAGFSSQSMVLSGLNQTLSGTSFSLKGFYDYDITTRLKARLGAGYEPFSTSKGNLKADYKYLSASGMGQYYLTDGSTKWWAGLGYTFLIAASKNVTGTGLEALAKSASTNQMLSIGGGIDIQMGKSIIPISLDYSMFPGSTDVSATSISLRAGYGF